jgi:putative tricarboxylic transport membrane protein
MSPDQRLAVVLLASSAAYLTGAVRIGAIAGQYAAVGPRVFPMVVGIGLLVTAAWMALPTATPTQLPPVRWKAAAASAFAFLAYIGALQVAGYVVATTGFMVLESRLLGSRAWARDIIVSLAITAAVYGVFRLLLGLRLPAGLLG